MSSVFVPRRRDVLVGGAAAAVVPALVIGAKAVTVSEQPEPSAGRPKKRAFQDQDLADWQSQIGWRFSVAGEHGRVPMKLIEVRKGADRNRPSNLARRNNFTATFEVDAATAPAGNFLYRVAHPLLGATALALQLGPVKGGKARISAMFN